MAKDRNNIKQYGRIGRHAGRMVSGFTLIEVLTVSFITVMIAGFLVTNFNRSRNDLSLAAPAIVGDIRNVQNLALSGSQLDDGTYRCGFGIVFDEAGYTMYAGPEADGTCQSTDDQSFGAGDEVIQRVELRDSLAIIDTSADIYYVPPRPFTFINGSRMTESAVITLSVRNQTCSPERCRLIEVDNAGRVTLKSYESQ